jgi:hypothetical protein
MAQNLEQVKQAILATLTERAKEVLGWWHQWTRLLGQSTSNWGRFRTHLLTEIPTRSIRWVSHFQYFGGWRKGVKYITPKQKNRTIPAAVLFG